LSPAVPGFASMGARKMRRLLERELGYREQLGSSRSGGSHVTLVSDGRPPIVWAYHDTRELSPLEVRRVLVRQVGLTLSRFHPAVIS
jgi:hypothetical protein